MNFLQIFTEKDGQFSSRRTGALFSLLFAAFLSVFIIIIKEIINWYVFIPVALFLGFSGLLFFFTTWEEIKSFVSIFAKKSE